MQVYWASVGLIVAILVFGFFTMILGYEDEVVPIKLLCVGIVVVAAVALGIRIEGGIF